MEVMNEAADAHADEAFERLRSLEEKREAEVAKALDPKDDSVDVSVALTNQIDMGIAKGYAQQMLNTVHPIMTELKLVREKI